MLVALASGMPGLPRTAALALLSLSVLFGVALFGGQLATPDRFGCIYFGEDFATLYASSRLILEGRGADIYDFKRLAEAQDAVREDARSLCDFHGVMAYPPGFLLPLLPLALFPPVLAYYVWTGLSFIIFLAALWHLARVSQVSPWRFWLIAAGFFPFVFGLLQGQVHAWQFVSLTELWLALQRRADRSAGLWLSLQLVKPQFLPFLVIYLAWWRWWRALGWFLAGGLIWVLLTGLFINGTPGVAVYVSVMWANVAVPDAAIGVWLMANWRSLALNSVGSDNLGLVSLITVTLTLVTGGLLIWSWRQHAKREPDLVPQLFLTLIAATLLAGYDTHIFSAVLLLTPGLLFLVQISRASGRLTQMWAFVMDFTLLSPSLLMAGSVALFLSRGVQLWWYPAAQALILGCTVILLGGVFLPQVRGSSGEKTLTGKREPQRIT